MSYVLTEHYTDRNGDKRFHSIEQFDEKPNHTKLHQFMAAQGKGITPDSVQNLLNGAGVVTDLGSTYRLEKQP